MIRQLVAVKKDNTRLRQSMETMQSLLKDCEIENERLKKSKDVISSSNIASDGESKVNGVKNYQRSLSSTLPTPLETGNENRYKGIIKRLKRLLEAERKSLRKVKIAYATELQSRTELEIFLRQCTEDVKFEISKRKTQLAIVGGAPHRPISPIKAGTSIKNVHLSDLSIPDRERVMELLLSQERVIELLYSKVNIVH